MVAIDEEDWGELGILPSVETIQERINARYDALFHYDKSGERHAFVCSVCNIFIGHIDDLTWFPIEELKKKQYLLQWDIINVGSNSVPKALQEAYCFNDRDGHLKDDTDWLKKIALSPRSVIGRKNSNNRSKFGFSCCSSCSHGLKSGFTPFFAIVNGNYVGHPPPCLKDLTPVELSLLTPVQGYGYCFSYVGGAQKNLQGTMTFMRVEERKTARAIAQLEAMGVSEYVVVLQIGRAHV